MTAQEALNIVKRLLKPKTLNSIQEIIFLESWAGKLYREIALEAGYDLDYVKEVGSQLWNLLSESLNEKVTKKNIKLILGSSEFGGIASKPIPLAPHQIKFPGGAVPLHSNTYIDHPLIQERAYAEINRPGSLIRIRGPRHIGKTSLMYRILTHAKQQEMSTVMLNLQAADRALFHQLDRFLRWFCINVSRQLQLEQKLDEFWDTEVGSKVSCTVYFQDYLLKELPTPLVLALDEIDQILKYPELTQDFLPLLRAWYEAAAEQPIWQKLRLVITHSTEVYIPLKLNQSPFNVGLPIQLSDFNQSQINELVERYDLKQIGINTSDLRPLLLLIGGHPYLLQLAFYHLKFENIALTHLLQNAPTQAGIYSSYLRQYWHKLQQQPDLLAAVKYVMTSPTAVQLDVTIACLLEGMGLIRLEGNEATPRYELYRLYFSSQIADIQR